MMGLCTSSDEVTKLLDGSKAKSLTPAVIRSAITQCGRMKEPSLACQLFDQYVFPSMNIRVWNVLLGALAEGAKQDNIILNMKDESGGGVSSSLNGLKCSEATRVILDIMSDSTTKTKVPFPNSQTYCLTASALQYGSTDADLALELFRNATYAGIPADGRFVNAIFRCFGDDVNSALESWKGEIRRACLEHESRTQRAPRSIYRSRNKNLIAAYNGLLYVCGRALRPDVAVRLAYAMNKEGIEPDGISINNYRAGKRIQAQLHPTATGIDEGGSIQRGKFFSKLLSKPNMVEQYESLLYIECTKYDPNNRIMSKDKRIRIIV
jgi:pentatricopeptide repeat protein